MRRDDSRDDREAWQTARPPMPEGAVRRLSQGLLQHRLFGRPRPTLGRFEVTGKLGEGGMGAVFEAVDPALGRRVALKVLREPDRPTPAVDIRHEARMLARLSHPNVVAVHELGDDEGEAYVCMALVDGPHLGAWLEAREGLPWQEVVRVMLGAASGLHAAHQAGIVHRDFKPENVLLGADGVPRVTDFGLARVGPAPGALVRAEDGRVTGVAGTPGYLAPEVLAGAPADARSDQYSFCVALRRCLDRAGAPPPDAVLAVVQRGGAAAPEDRWPDMGAVADALEALVRRRGNPDQRARDVLIGRVRSQWIAPVQAAAFGATGAELPLRCELRAGGPLPSDGSAAAIARALHDRRATVVLVGAPGAGKTLRLLAVAHALAALDAEVDGATLPVVLHLSSFPAADGDLVAWVLHEMVAKYALPRADAERWVREGSVALLLDGLDEVADADRARCVAALDALRLDRPLAWLLTCREGVYDTLHPPRTADVTLRLCPPDAPTLRAALEAVPEALDDPALVEQLANPLLLSLFLRVTGDPADAAAGSLRERLYAGTLRHGLDQAPALRGLERDAATAQLIWLAQATQRAGVTDLWLEDLQGSWLPGRAQRWMATGLGLTLIYGISFAANLGAARIAGLPPASGWFFGWLAATAAIVIQGHLRVVPMEAMRWSWPRVRAWIPRNLLLGVATGLLHGVFYDLWADLILGTATGLLGLSVIGLVPQGRERRSNPGDGLLESLRNAALVAPVIGLVIGAPVGWIALPLAAPLAAPDSMYHTHPSPGFAWAVTMGTSAAVTSALITGLFAPLLHLALRLTLAATTPLPLRLVPMLDDLARRGLLLRIGGGWMFRHPTFRAWLADHPIA